jgi:ferredoxin--NADP+ reductase/benzoate/toluate 1,2-dioxygenase reductase subunit
LQTEARKGVSFIKYTKFAALYKTAAMTFHSKNQAGKNSMLRNKAVMPAENHPLTMRKVYRLQHKRNLTSSAYILRFDRNGMDFSAGNHITLGLPGNNQVREYSIYSTEQDESLEVLIKAVDEGLVSNQLHQLVPGSLLDVDGPFGSFTLDPEHLGRKFLFVATGTGISPFHSMAGSYPGLDFLLLHGVRTREEAYEKEWFAPERYILCTSRDASGDFHGRVTGYLRDNLPDMYTLVYLCGNCDMIYEVYDLLTSRGFPAGNIKTEVYF